MGFCFFPSFTGTGRWGFRLLYRTRFSPSFTGLTNPIIRLLYRGKVLGSTDESGSFTGVKILPPLQELNFCLLYRTGSDYPDRPVAPRRTPSTQESCDHTGVPPQWSERRGVHPPPRRREQRRSDNTFGILRKWAERAIEFLLHHFI
jgi:hypothetical protein